MISRENYEIWMIDYLDGILSDADQALLFRFLDENPELKVELDGLDKTILHASDSHFADKCELLKTEADVFEMDYPDYIAIKEQEEGLEQEEEEWKCEYLKQSASNNLLFKTYAKIKLKADATIVFKQKNTLKRAVLIPWVNQHSIFKISVAAIVAILLSIGTLPFLKNQSNTIQTLVVNDPPSLINLPSVGNNVDKQKLKENNVNTQIAPLTSENVLESKAESNTVIQREVIKEMIKPIKPQGIESVFRNKNISAYEIGLNAMMPVLIANNLEQKKLDEMDRQKQIQQESARLSRSSWVIASGVKVINFLAGDDTQVKKYINQNGDLVAYQLESDNISISRKIKSIPVTN